MGLIQRRKNRKTKTNIEVVDGKDSEYCTEGGRWITLCVDHGFIMNYDTVTAAKKSASLPEDWCEECQKIIEQKRKKN
jgi:hypothetical protein